MQEPQEPIPFPRTREQILDEIEETDFQNLPRLRALIRELNDLEKMMEGRIQ